VAYTDPYGNEFVDVPINVTPYNRTTAIFQDLEILYDYAANVDRNPATGDLSSALVELTSPKPGSYNTTIPLLVSSTSAGRLALQGLRLDLHAPYHRPSITAFFPAANAVVREGQGLELGVNGTDWYGAPLTYKWFYNGQVVDGLAGDRMTVSYGFQDAGTYTARVEVSNLYETVSQEWKIIVQNVNRPPEITAFSPDGDREMSEGTTQAFSVSVTDPDGDPIGYMWTVDGVMQGSSTSSSFTYRPDYNSAGSHLVKVTAVDTGSLSSATEWRIRVKDVDRPPLLTVWDPIDDPILMETQQLQFMVGSQDPDGQELATVWKLDDRTVAEGGTYLFKTDYSSAGVKTLVATVTDGELASSREWKITVLDLNRPPAAVIDQPRENAEYMQGAAIHFGGNSSSDPDGEKLTYSWKEGGVLLSDQAEFDMAFTHGIHTITLDVRDHAGATSQATVHFRVRWVQISLVMGLDRTEPAAGDRVTIIVTMGNTGDTRAAQQQLDILVDGKKVATGDLPALSSGASYKTQFEWKATKGDHTITAVAGGQSWNQPVTVSAAKQAAAGTQTTDYLWMAMIAAIAVGLALWGRSATGRK
jgi:PKD repeat protein